MKVKRKDQMNEAEANALSERGTGVQGKCMGKDASTWAYFVV